MTRRCSAWRTVSVARGLFYGFTAMVVVLLVVGFFREARYVATLALVAATGVATTETGVATTEQPKAKGWRLLLILALFDFVVAVAPALVDD